MRKQFFIGITIAGICLYYALRGVSFQDTIHAMAAAHLGWIALGMMIYTMGYLLRGVRWKILVDPIKVIPVTQLLGPMILGFFANNILPFRMGEFVRAHITGRKFDISRTASLGTILLERLLDTISFLATFLVSAFFFPFPRTVEKGAAFLGGACVLVIAGLILAIRYHVHADAILEKVKLPERWKVQINDVVRNFVHGVSSMKRASDVLLALVLSLIIWTIEGTTLYLFVRAFPISFSYPQSFFLLFFMGLSVTLPQAPGYVGTLELFGVTALALLGIPRSQGLPVILTIHALEFAFIFTLGVTFLLKEHLSLKSIIENGNGRGG